MWQSLSKIKKLASSIQHKERKCTNKKVVLEKKKPKSRSNELYVNLFFDAVQPNLSALKSWHNNLFLSGVWYQQHCHGGARSCLVKFLVEALLFALTNLLLIDQSQIDFRCPALFRQRPSSLHFFTKIRLTSDLVLWYFFWHFASWVQTYSRFRNRHVGQKINVGPSLVLIWLNKIC